MMKAHYKITVKGKVQGVFYRASTQHKARELNLTGWVKNEPDGSVYIEAEGESEQLANLVEWCKSGPAAAVVDEVDVQSSNHLNGFDKFNIRR